MWRDPGSTFNDNVDVRAAGRLFRQAIATRFSQSMDNAVLAQHMGEYLDELGSGLPAALRDEPLTPRLCLNALRDALSYREGGQEARRVEERRYRHVVPLAPNLFNQALPLSAAFGGGSARDSRQSHYPPPAGERIWQVPYPLPRVRRPARVEQA